jgi:hypothetical protein
MDEYRCNFLNVGRDILRFKAKIPAKVTIRSLSLTLTIT